ncbi:hypothetical protein [Pseudomonas kilonensis]|uniref:hypothetical protein n=1 Tax=Pseudomonas kilonensis TaxID=132476 RepID=UPI0004677549|nr:hypothetical protein [Pseudomonas kilonensis]
MNKQSGFLLDKVLRHDLVLVHVTGAPRPQVLRAKIGRIFLQGKELFAAFLIQKLNSFDLVVRGGM